MVRQIKATDDLEKAKLAISNKEWLQFAQNKPYLNDWVFVDDYISISTLNDFIFCPYSIYLHNVYMDTDEGLYHAKPQLRGKIAHESVDKKTASNRKEELLSLPVYSKRYKLMGKVDVYRLHEKKVIERKYRLKQIFQGQIYQLWAQYFCLTEMGYVVELLAFYEI